MASKKIQKNKGIIIYQAKSGAIEFRGDFTHETIWATLDQIAHVFGRDKSVISRHLSNIYKEGELDAKSTVAKNATVQIEGVRRIQRIIEYYNLDAIISVGYRINSKTATKFQTPYSCSLCSQLTGQANQNFKIQISNNFRF